MPRIFKVSIKVFGVIIGVNKIIARIIRRINIDHFDFLDYLLKTLHFLNNVSSMKRKSENAD